MPYMDDTVYRSTYKLPEYPVNPANPGPKDGFMNPHYYRWIPRGYNAEENAHWEAESGRNVLEARGHAKGPAFPPPQPRRPQIPQAVYYTDLPPIMDQHRALMARIPPLPAEILPG